MSVNWQLDGDEDEREEQLERIETFKARLKPYATNPFMTVGEVVERYLADHPETTFEELTDGLPQAMVRNQ